MSTQEMKQIFIEEDVFVGGCFSKHCNLKLVGERNRTVSNEDNIDCKAKKHLKMTSEKRRIPSVHKNCFSKSVHIFQCLIYSS